MGRIASRFSILGSGVRCLTLSTKGTRFGILPWTSFTSLHGFASMAGPDEVIADVRGSVAVLTLNRPKALNSLNHHMVESMLGHYKAWVADNGVHSVVLKGAGGKAFCAGGDVKSMVQFMLGDRQSHAQSFFRKEYELNHLIGTLPLTHIALMEGITMGGGAGVSIHGAFRVATEKTLFAMPECGIGLFPDVGGSHFLTRLPGELGTYLALTGARLQGIQVLEAQLATHYIPSSLLPELEDAIISLGPRAGDRRAVAELLGSFQSRNALPPSSGLLGQLNTIDDAFVYSQVEDIYAALHKRGDDWGKATLAAMMKGSPLSQKLTLRQLREGRWLDLAACLMMEFRMVTRTIYEKSDFVEGVRALLIEKTGSPHWSPARLEEVSNASVEQFFKAFANSDEELALDARTLGPRARL